MQLANLDAEFNVFGEGRPTSIAHTECFYILILVSTFVLLQPAIHLMALGPMNRLRLWTRAPPCAWAHKHEGLNGCSTEFVF